MTTTSIKLLMGGAIIASVTAYMAYVGASTSWQYYLTVDECLAGAEEVGSARLRVHGKVVPGSLDMAADRTQAEFQLGGQSGQLRVVCCGSLPDNLKEDMEVVVEGQLASATSLTANRVLTKCASKYETRTAASTAPGRYAPDVKGDSE